MGLNLNKGVILGAFGGILVFLVAIVFIMYVNSDFDQQLINQVESGVPTEKLIPQIDKETQKMKLNAQKRYNSHLLSYNEKKGELASPNNYNHYLLAYNEELKMISNYDEIRKKYAKREITKEQFLNDITDSKYFIEKVHN